MRAEVVSKHRGGMWAWLFQRVTAVLLIVLLAIHLTVTHLYNIGKLDYDTIGARVAHAGFTAVDILLLVAAIYHALNGLRMVLMDYWFASRDRARILTIAFWVIGIAALAYGVWALWPWIGYRVG